MPWCLIWGRSRPDLYMPVLVQNRLTSTQLHTGGKSVCYASERHGSIGAFLSLRSALKLQKTEEIQQRKGDVAPAKNAQTKKTTEERPHFLPSKGQSTGINYFTDVASEVANMKR